MRSISRYFLTFIALGSLMAGCSDDDTPTEPNGGGQSEIPEQPSDRPYEGYEGYMFVLDQSQIPSNSGYESERDVPQAKLVAISPEGKVSPDIVAERNPDLTLGFDCRLQRTGDHFVIFAKREWLKDDTNLKAKATVIAAKSLDIKSQVAFDLPENTDYDFLEAVNEEVAFIGYQGKNIYRVNLKDGSTQKFADAEYNTNIGAFGYKNTLLTFVGNTLRILSAENGQTQGEVTLPKSVRRAYRSTDNTLVLQYTDYNCGLLSIGEQKLIKEFKEPKPELALNSMEYDAAHQLIYAPGKDRNKDKIYTLDLSQENVKAELFYVVPPTDIDKSKVVTGAIKIGLQPDKCQMYIGYVNDLVIVGEVGNQRGSRSGFISRLSLEGKEGVELPITEPDEKTKFEDMYTFSSFFFVSK